MMLATHNILTFYRLTPFMRRMMMTSMIQVPCAHPGKGETGSR